MPDPEVYPEVHPYLTDEERTAIALRRQEMMEKEGADSAGQEQTATGEQQPQQQ